MRNKYFRWHTLSLIVQIIIFLVLYVVNWNLHWIPNGVAFIITGSCTVLQALIWRAYVVRDEELDCAVETILKNMPATVVLDIVNGRGDIHAELVASKQSKESTP